MAFGFLCRAAFAGSVLALALAAVPARGSVLTELVVTDPLAGTALFGFDAVSYFIEDGARAGTGAHEVSFRGLSWRFSSAGNRAAFKDRPDVYVPRFGGYDPVALMRGAPVPGHPGVYAVHDGRLFLFQRGENREAFLADPRRVLESAEIRWPSVRRMLTP